jgi:hypothetical protein
VHGRSFFIELIAIALDTLRKEANMKSLGLHNRTRIAICLLICIVSWKAKSASFSSDSSNLIQNSSFEINDQPTLQSWVADTTLAQFFQDAPPAGGKWSLRISPGWIPQEGFARTYISGQSAVGVYRVAFWAKSINGWKGSASFGQWNQNAWVRSKRIYCDSTSWTQFSLVDTLSLQPNDTIAVHLSAGAVELSNGQILFDLVELKRIQTITAIDREPYSVPTRLALSQNYPNPFNPSTTISFSLRAKLFVSLKVFDLMGREVASLVSQELSAGQHSREWNASGMPSGVYFCRLQARPTDGGRAGVFIDSRKLVLLK